MYITCKPYEVGMITNFIKGTNKILESVMYFVRLL
jgi:hypothetical protein